MMIRSGDAALHVRDEGPRDGPVVLFANSLGTDLRVFDALVAQLPPDLRIVRYDKRGHGLSDLTPGPYTIDMLSDDAIAICETLDLRNVTFVGLSIGGLIAQSFAIKRPDLTQALVLMDTAAKIGTAESWGERIAALSEGGIAAISDGILPRWFSPAFLGSPEASQWRNMLERTTLEGYIACCHALAAADLTEGSTQIACPAMAIAGALDGSTPPELVAETAKLCHATFHIVDDAGHLPCVEKPEAVAALITDFLEKTRHD
nr:3-oxoadipate enol-lactonase [uncultured Martelella sp.]